MGKVKELKQQKAEAKLRKQINKAASPYLSEQEEGDNYDAYLKLLKESDMGNNDCLAADYVLVWRPWENSLTVANFINLIENNIESPEMPEFMANIDWKLLRKQKETLIEEIDTMEKKNAEYFEETINDFNGILNLIDSLQDSAVDEYELKETLVFGENEEIEICTGIKDSKNVQR